MTVEAFYSTPLIESWSRVFDGLGFEVWRLDVRLQIGSRNSTTTTYQARCVCGARQPKPGSRSAANRWRKQHRRTCKP